MIACGSNSSTVIILLKEDDTIVDVGLADSVNCPNSLLTFIGESAFNVTIPRL
jgi:hypothetical protein